MLPKNTWMGWCIIASKAVQGYTTADIETTAAANNYDPKDDVKATTPTAHG